METEDICCICLEILEDFNTIKFGCKHIIHGGCFAEILKISHEPRCPTCRRYLTEFNGLNRIVIDIDSDDESDIEEEDGVVVDIDNEPELFFKVSYINPLRLRRLF